VDGHDWGQRWWCIGTCCANRGGDESGVWCWCWGDKERWVLERDMRRWRDEDEGGGSGSPRVFFRMFKPRKWERERR